MLIFYKKNNIRSKMLKTKNVHGLLLLFFFFCGLTRSFEAVSDAARPAYVVDEGAEHVAPEVIRPVLALLIDQPEATANYLLH